ncbi:MAG: formate dehydrogenase accessory sulfurtransferase FdhD [Polyangiaceae bacterium]|nr:formate dehydrogenase accessory sulfurtransferase FdhD [Polyangiaceae bacterium]MCE7888381.1 formate dehydrogenase accessory sulfurtransferase FdhD [Sorangiineae bacterium PRO1]
MSDKSVAQGSAVRHHADGGSETLEESIVVEEPLELRISGDTFAITMRTPGHDRELAAGLLLSEGLIASAADLGGIAHCGRPGDEGYGNTLDVTAAPGTVLDGERVALARRGTLMSASCGVCGRRSIDDLMARVGPIEDASRFERAVLAELTARLRAEQPVFAKTGGLHAAGVADARGNWLVVREDVGRHNAVDKVVGRLLLDGALPARGQLLVVSGRTSFEIVQKAVVAGFPAVVAVSAPTSMAVATAERAGLTLLGFSRQGAFNVYSGSERIAG